MAIETVAFQRLPVTRRSFGRLAGAIVCLIAAGIVNAAEKTGPSLSVDLAADRHTISPDIYGMAYPDPALAKELRLPLNRWGGDGTTRYNWNVDGTNAGDDWFFMAGSGKPNPVPSAGPDWLLNVAKTYGGRVLLTIPIIEFINSATATDSSFPVSVVGKQQKVNPYVHPKINGAVTDAGNGRTPDGKPIVLTPEQVLRVHVRNSPDLQRGWIEHLVKTFGDTAHGGVAYYELDNEPGGWNNTHRDVHPDLTGHDELVNHSVAYAAMIKSVDPTAQIVGPGDFVMHYQSDGKPGDGKKEHENLGQGNYYLQQMREYEKTHGVRLLDYFDEHYYPLDQEGQTPDTLLESTRSLWDATYKEKNWVGKYQGAKEIIPKLHRWVDEYYPGTKVSISEYGWGDGKTLVSALAYADVLGIFGRERVDMACAFGPPKVNDAAANAFRVYLNYDDKGSRFGDVSVRATSEDQASLSIYAAERSVDHAVTLVIINKTHDDLATTMSLAHFTHGPAAKVFRYGGARPRVIMGQPDQAIEANACKLAFPAQTVTLLVIPRG